MAENSTFSCLFYSSEISRFTPTSNLKNKVTFLVFCVKFSSFMIKFFKVRNSWDLGLECFKLRNTTWWSPSSQSWKTSFYVFLNTSFGSLADFCLFNCSAMCANSFIWFLWFHCCVTPSWIVLPSWLGLRARQRFIE